MTQQYTDDYDLDSFTNHQLLPPHLISRAWRCKLIWAVSEARRAGRKWTQPEIISETMIPRHELESYSSGKKMPPQDHANKMAIAQGYPPLRRLTPHIEKKEVIILRSDHEMSCLERLVEHRDPKLIAEIMEIASEYERAQNWEQRKRADLRLHQLPLRYHVDPLILRWLHEMLARRIDFYAHEVAYLNIPEFEHRLRLHKIAHRNLFKFLCEEKPENIRECWMEHHRFLYQNAVSVENFLQRQRRLESWGSLLRNPSLE